MPESILILNISGIGDFVESTPLLRRVRELHPTATVVLVVAEKAYPLARRCPYVNEVVALPTSAGRSIPRLRDVPRWFQSIRPLRGRFDIAMNLYRVASTPGALWIRFLVAWSGAKTVRERPTTVEEHPGPELWISDQMMEDTLQWSRTLEGLPIAVFLGGERRTRHEKPARAETWLKEIQERWHVHPVIIGLPSDPGLPPATRIKHTDMRGKSDIERSAAIIACSSALITTHSAPQHFAGVWDVPTVVLVGPGDDRLYRPALKPHQMRILRNPVPCSPCYYQDCPLKGIENQKCMTGISSDRIVQAFSEVFRTTTTR